MHVVVAAGFVCSLAACYSPSYLDCEVSCSGNVCPSGFTCDTTRHVCRSEGASGACPSLADAAPDLNPSGDEDSDTILNGEDNCPLRANTDQYNEDRDTFGDVCDPCPISGAVGADDDEDGDSVGDGCDPDPNRINRIDRFVGFNGTTSPVGALLTAGVWSFSNGDALLATTSAQPRASLTFPLGTHPADYVSAGFTINSPGNTTLHGMGVTPAYSDASSSGVACWIARTSTGIGIHLGPPGSSQDYFAPAPLQAGQTAVLRASRVTDAYECRDSVSNTGTSGVVSFSAITHAGLYATDISGRYHWLMIVSRPD